MKSTKHISFYCVDNDVIDLDFFRENFKPKLNYTLFTFNSVQMFLNKLKTDVKDSSFKIVIIDNIITSRGMNTKTALELIPKIKSIDKEIEVVIFADSENIELKATSSNVKPAAFIKKDSQYFVRLYPLISRLISEYNLKKKVRDSRVAVIIVLIVFALAAAGLLLAYFFLG
jgi:DNA-binding NtrC family response regulator